MRFVAGRERDGGIEVLGTVEALDIDAARRAAQQTWPDCGVMPWSAFERARRAQLALGLPELKEPAA